MGTKRGLANFEKKRAFYVARCLRLKEHESQLLGCIKKKQQQKLRLMLLLKKIKTTKTRVKRAMISFTLQLLMQQTK